MNDISLDFTTTACCRPELLEKTYKSFSKNIHGVDFSRSTLYINIDPVPNSNSTKGCLDIAESYFGTVIYNLPDNPNFTSALKWCWSRKFKSEFFFHLEDDWKCVRKININEILELFRKNEKIVAVNLRAYDNRFTKLCLSPSIWKSQYANDTANNLNINYNPEKQIRGDSVDGKNFLGTVVGNNYSIHYPQKRIIIDLGRKWMIKNKFKKKNKLNGGFKEWESI